MSDGSRVFPPLDAPSERFPYRIDRQVGIGSTGVVYKAVEVPLDRKVAIKVLRRSVLDEELPDVQEEIRRRFLQEARAAAALSHPGVTTVYRVGKEGDLPYMVMEWLDGRSLEEVLEDRSRLDVPEAVRLVVSLLETLDAAHRQGVVHRDVKPSNLMLLDDGRLKVTDFGIALFKGRELVKTQAGVVLATPKFASPEQLRGLDVDGRADLFAVGILLYRLVTGCFPFEGAGFLELTTAILQREPVPAREHHAGIPPALEAVLRRALRKSRKDRFATAAEMARELRPFLSAGHRMGTAGATTSSRSGGGRGHEAAGEERPAGGLVVSSVADGEPVYRELPLDLAAALVRVAASWPGRELAPQPTDELLDRLLETPLHAPPFTGAARIDDRCLLISEGVLVGAVDVRGGRRGDAVVESLPAVSGPRLHPLPEDLSSRTVDHFATLLRAPRVRHGDLDTSLIDLEALARKLREERFDGLLRLRLGEAFGAVLFAGGRSTLSLFSQGWGEAPVARSWRHWLTRFPVRASVERLDVEPLDAWHRRHFRGWELAVTTGSDAPELTPTGSAELTAEALEGCRRTPAFRLLCWTLGELPRILAERERLSRWKYLGEWIPRVRRAWVYHDLPRPGERAADRFDWVTAEDGGKVLHVGQHVARLTVPAFQAFLERVIAAKKARLKAGDVGGALLFAPELSEDVLDAYDRALASGAKAWFGVEESFTGYSGFVRIGARRGFHLLLVEDGDRGLTPLL